MKFWSTVPSVLVTACCAPMTSLFSRDCSEPVCVRVKNAIGIRCTWSNSCDPQVVDEALADACRVVPLDEREHAVGEREPDRGQRDPRHQPAVVLAGWRVSSRLLSSERGERGGDRGQR